MATTRATELGQLAKLVTVDSDGNSVISGTFDATLPASGVVAGVHGSASSVPTMSVTAQGLIDSVGSAHHWPWWVWGVGAVWHHAQRWLCW